MVVHPVPRRDETTRPLGIRVRLAPRFEPQRSVTRSWRAMTFSALPALNHSICSAAERVRHSNSTMVPSGLRDPAAHRCARAPARRGREPRSGRPRRSPRRCAGSVNVSGSTPCFFRLVSWMRANDAGEDRHAAAIARLHGGVLTRRPFAIVLVADRAPRHAGLGEALGDVGERAGLRRRAGPCPSPVIAGERVDRPRETGCRRCSRGGRGSVSHRPAAEMWSVVHLPLALSSTGRSM